MPKKPRVTAILINHDRCKGCEICVALCPKNVLAMSEGKAVVKDLPSCIGCDFCELRCPDFAIVLVRDAVEGSADQGGQDG